MAQLAARAHPRSTTARVLNVVLTGDVRSGTAAVASSLGKAHRLVCHMNLMHSDPRVRRKSHESYFELSPDGVGAYPWFATAADNAYQYLTHSIFGNALCDERVIVARLLYPEAYAHELYDLFAERFHARDLCMVHVRRNPAACYVSLRQAKASGCWQRNHNQQAALVPPRVHVEPDELMAFVRRHVSMRGKLDACCQDRLDVEYKNLFVDFTAIMRQVYGFVELPADNPAPTDYVRLRNRPMIDRVSNWSALRAGVSCEVRALLDADDFF